MSFLGRLGLKPVFNSEPNHGEIVEDSVKPIDFANDVSIVQEPGALEALPIKIIQKRFKISDLGFTDHGDDYPKTLEIDGCTLTQEMLIVFPGYTVWAILDEEKEMLIQLFLEPDFVKPKAMVWVMYQSGFVYDTRVTKIDGHLVFPPGTYMFKSDADEYTAEFNILV